MGDDRGPYEGFLYAAHKDALAVEALAHDVGTHCEIIAFLCQQMAEKVIKNLYVTNGEDPPRTHAIDDLVMHAVASGWIEDTGSILDAAADLSTFAVAARYATTPDIGTGEALLAIIEANAIADAVGSGGFETVTIGVDVSLLRDRDA